VARRQGNGSITKPAGPIRASPGGCEGRLRRALKSAPRSITGTRKRCWMMSTRQPVRSDSSVLLRSVCHCASAAHGRTAACRLEQCSWRESRLGQSRAGAERTVGAPKSSSPRGSTRKVPINIGSRSYSEGTSEPCYCGHTCSTDYTPRQVPTPGASQRRFHTIQKRHRHPDCVETNAR